MAASLKLAKNKVKMNNKLDKLYAQNKEKINEWIGKLYIYDVKDNKVQGLFDGSGRRINTEEKNVVYDLIFKWIKNKANTKTHNVKTSLQKRTSYSRALPCKSSQSKIKKSYK